MNIKRRYICHVVLCRSKYKYTAALLSPASKRLSPIQHPGVLGWFTSRVCVDFLGLQHILAVIVRAAFWDRLKYNRAVQSCDCACAIKRGREQSKPTRSLGLPIRAEQNFGFYSKLIEMYNNLAKAWICA